MSRQEIEIEVQVSMTIDNDEILDSGSDCGDSNSAVSDRFSFFTRNRMIRLNDDCVESELIKTNFLSGMGLAGNDTNIVAIHKNMGGDLTRNARFESFKIFAQAVAQKNGGNANISYGWYGGSRDELCEILLHGFSRCRGPTPNSQSYGGVGIHLSPTKFACDSALSSAADESGLRHVLLCRVIVGKMEIVAPGSRQFHPSSQELDTGVDCLSNPRRYIVWSAFMNSHIYPCYVLSFKVPPPNVVSGIQPRQASASKLNPSKRMSFPVLLSILSKVLPPQKLHMIAKCYGEFIARKITRPQMIQRIRQIGGDKLLVAVIRHLRIVKMGHPAKANV